MEASSSTRRDAPPALQEFYLQGSIMDQHCEVLLQRLRGLCDNAEDTPEAYKDHERVYKIRGPTGSPLVLRARQSVLHPENPWHLRYVGQPEIGDKNRPTMIRSVIDVCTSNNLSQFLTELGFRLDFEFSIQGYIFKKGRMKVTVSKVYRIVHPNAEIIESLVDSYFVELSVVAPAGQEAVGDEVKAFAEQLKPLINLEKIDIRRLQNF